MECQQEDYNPQEQVDQGAHQKIQQQMTKKLTTYMASRGLYKAVVRHIPTFLSKDEFLNGLNVQLEVDHWYFQQGGSKTPSSIGNVKARLYQVGTEYSVAYFGFKERSTMEQFIEKYDQFVVDVQNKRKYILQVIECWYQDMPQKSVEEDTKQPVSPSKEEDTTAADIDEDTLVEEELGEDFKHFRSKMGVKAERLLPLAEQIQQKKDAEAALEAEQRVMDESERALITFMTSSENQEFSDSLLQDDGELGVSVAESAYQKAPETVEDQGSKKKKPKQPLKVAPLVAAINEDEDDYDYRRRGKKQQHQQKRKQMQKMKKQNDKSQRYHRDEEQYDSGDKRYEQQRPDEDRANVQEQAYNFAPQRNNNYRERNQPRDNREQEQYHQQRDQGQVPQQNPQRQQPQRAPQDNEAQPVRDYQRERQEGGRDQQYQEPYGKAPQRNQNRYDNRQEEQQHHQQYQDKKGFQFRNNDRDYGYQKRDNRQGGGQYQNRQQRQQYGNQQQQSHRTVSYQQQAVAPQQPQQVQQQQVYYQQPVQLAGTAQQPLTVEQQKVLSNMTPQQLQAYQQQLQWQQMQQRAYVQPSAAQQYMMQQAQSRLMQNSVQNYYQQFQGQGQPQVAVPVTAMQVPQVQATSSSAAAPLKLSQDATFTPTVQSHAFVPGEVAKPRADVFVPTPVVAQQVALDKQKSESSAN